MVFFLSDAHFGIELPGCEQREQHFFDLIQTIPSDSTLFILGDLFDFWIEYRYSVRPDYFHVLHHLMMLKDRGVKICYLAGNHDFALGDFLQKNLGISIYLDSLETTIQGKKIYMYHGDGLIKKDIGYRLLKKVLRNQFNQKIYRLLHPNIGVPLGVFFSGSSRKYLRKTLSDEIISEYRNCAKERLDAGNEIVLFAHTHHPDHLTIGTKTYCNIGSWLINYNFATLQDGCFKLWRYRLGLSPEEIPPREMK